MATAGAIGGMERVFEIFDTEPEVANKPGAIKAKAIVMPSKTDQYFPPIDNENEVALMPNAELRVIPSLLGHFAPYNPDDQKFIDVAINDLLKK